MAQPTEQKAPKNRRVLALDCEMVEVTRGVLLRGDGELETRSNALARCSVVDESGNIVLDEYVTPSHRYIDFISVLMH